jgi:hypothetical protein
MVAAVFSSNASVFQDAHPEQSADEVAQKQLEMKAKAQQDQAAAQKAAESQAADAAKAAQASAKNGPGQGS